MSEANGELNKIVDEALREPVIPATVLEARDARLSEAERHLYGAIVAAFPKLGGPPSLAWTQAAAGKLGLAAESALSKFAELDLIVRGGESGAISGAYPYSGEPTPHRVEVEGGLPVYAMCAVDALGIPFMVRRDAQIVSEDTTSREPVRVAVRGGVAASDPPDAVVFFSSSGRSGTAAESTCPVINFFRSRQSAEEYVRSHPEAEGTILTLAEALDWGRRFFGVAEDAAAPQGRPGSGGCCG